MSGLSVYRVEPDLVRFRSLIYDMPAEEFRTVSVAGEWPTPPVYIEDFTHETPDIWQILSGGMLAVATPVLERLEPFLSQAGALLPLQDNTGEDLELWALHIQMVLPLRDCIDVSYGEEERRRLLEEGLARIDADAEAAAAARAGLARGDPFPYLAPAFIAESLEIPATFFRVDRLTASKFLLERDDDEDTLLRRIERFGITGLDLRLVWSSETGPADWNLF